MVCVKKFSHFANSIFFITTKSVVSENNLLRNVLTTLRGKDWKRVRNRVTPAFTTGKLKKLIPILNESTKKFFSIIDAQVKEQKELLLREFMGRLGLDVIGRVGFSLDLNTHGDNENAFLCTLEMQWMACFMVGKHLSSVILIALPLYQLFCPFFAEIFETVFGVDLVENASQNFFSKFLIDLYNQRKADPQASKKYNDIFQLLMNAVEENDENNNAISKNIEDSDIIHQEIYENNTDSSNNDRNISKVELVAQSYVILVAGYEATAETLHLAIYLLALHQDIQDHVREEIFHVMGDDDEVSYEHLTKFHYLVQVIQETLRMFPPAPRINRECTQDITLNGIQLVEGDMVNIPVFALHNNPNYFPQPEKFDPDRFCSEEKSKRQPYSYVPFGAGPRNCIGQRFADFQLRIVLALLLRTYKFVKGNNSPELPLKMKCLEMTRPVEELFVKAQPYKY